MDFFDKIGKKASQTYKYTADKTSRIAKEAKTKMAMNENKSKISELYSAIGKEVYQNFVREEKVDLKELLTHKCEEIDVISNEIERQRMEILALNNKKQCDNCYVEMNINDNFCPNCGASQHEKQVEVHEALSNDETDNFEEVQEDDDIINLE